MKIAAVVAEYNPFHLGHAWQLQEIKNRYNTDACIVIMSGNYVQRGAPAIVDKFTRAKWALQYGADIVFELPSVFATAGAEQFAYGACSLLDKLGFIDILCFGSEIVDSKIIEKIADILIEPPCSYEKNLKKLLCQGESYAKAREASLYPFLKNEFSTEAFHTIFSAPNTILGIEYYKALKKRKSRILPVPLPRKGSYHSTSLPKSSIACSASAIRTHLFQSPIAFHALLPFLPELVLTDLSLLPLMQENDISSCLYYALLSKNAKELQTYYEVSFDLAQRIVHYLPKFQNMTGFIELLKSKQYAYARIKRALLHVLLSVKKEEPFQEYYFLRLLGLKKESSYLLRNIEKQTGLTIITKAADGKKRLSCHHNYINDTLLFDKEISASQFYGFLFHQKGNFVNPYQELAKTPIIL